jgi:hypothetical protein
LNKANEPAVNTKAAPQKGDKAEQEIVLPGYCGEPVNVQAIC